ncbi:TNT domain-containing protein [Streptomyces lavendulae]|uniref:TNT domain-containing protein n=1 Tax=Streptomyces lavendulae TaxID=1914 RepID=UPI00371B6C29
MLIFFSNGVSVRRHRTAAIPAIVLFLLMLSVTSATAMTDPSAPPALCTGRFDDDARLGPEALPSVGQHPLGGLLDGWLRTGGLEPSEFLRRYWDGPPDAGRWKYPPHDGFAEVNGTADQTAVELPAGSMLDRFGRDSGTFLTSAGTPYATRSLPPQSLRTSDDGAVCGYHLYEVTRPFPVRSGPTAPWFGQPGGGLQIKLDAELLDPGPRQRLNVRWLLDHGYLASRTPVE